MEVGMADVAVVRPIPVVLGLEVDDPHPAVMYPLVGRREHRAVSLRPRGGTRRRQRDEPNAVMRWAVSRLASWSSPSRSSSHC
jgi:hypothetical protein